MLILLGRSHLSIRGNFSPSFLWNPLTFEAVALTIMRKVQCKNCECLQCVTFNKENVASNLQCVLAGIYHARDKLGLVNITQTRTATRIVIVDLWVSARP